MDTFFAPYNFFAEHPDVTFKVALIFLFFYIILVLFRGITWTLGWPLLLNSIVWGLWPLWEEYCRRGGYNIRVDIFFFYPLLLILTFLGLIWIIFGSLSCIEQLISSIRKKGGAD